MLVSISGTIFYTDGKTGPQAHGTIHRKNARNEPGNNKEIRSLSLLHCTRLAAAWRPLNDQTSNPKVGCSQKLVQKIRNAFCHGTRWMMMTHSVQNAPPPKKHIRIGTFQLKRTAALFQQLLHSKQTCKISPTKLNRTNREPNNHRNQHGSRTDGGGEQKKNERTRTVSRNFWRSQASSLKG